MVLRGLVKGVTNAEAFERGCGDAQDIGCDLSHFRGEVLRNIPRAPVLVMPSQAALFSLHIRKRNESDKSVNSFT